MVVTVVPGRWWQDQGSGNGRTVVVATPHQMLCKRKGTELEMCRRCPGRALCRGRAGPSRAGRRELRRVRTGPRLGLRAGHRHRHRHPHRHLPATPGVRAGHRHRDPHRDQDPRATPEVASGAPTPGLVQGSGPALLGHAWGRCEPDTETGTGTWTPEPRLGLRAGHQHRDALPRRDSCATPTRCPQVCPWSDPARGSRQLCQHGGTLAATTASMSDFWHKLGCCVVEKPQPKKRRRRIDRSMIGEPMNFVHLTHIGSGDMAAGEGLPMTGAVQEMRSKGGRERQWSNSRVL